MNLKNYPRKHYAINQFCQPHNHELKGRKFYFSMDGGTDYAIDPDDIRLPYNILRAIVIATRYADLAIADAEDG